MDDSWEDHVVLHEGIKLVGGHVQIGHLRSDLLDGLWSDQAGWSGIIEQEGQL